jgi:hypothetical protein
LTRKDFRGWQRSDDKNVYPPRSVPVVFTTWKWAIYGHFQHLRCSIRRWRAAVLAEERAADPAAAVSEWDAQFRIDVGAYLDDA